MVALAIATSSAGTSATASDWHASVGVASNYLMRGLTRSSNGPAIQAHLGWTSDTRWSAGVWASTVEYRRAASPHQEFDFYVARAWQPARDWRLSAQLTRYESQGDSGLLPYDYTEVRAAVAFRDALSVSLALTPDYSFYSSRGLARDRMATISELTGQLPVSRNVRLTAGIGHSALEHPFGRSYWFWSAGTDMSWRRLSLAVSYVGADGTAERLFGNHAVGNDWVATLALRVL
jgi:uncharacterized protein (TIGR02001 family)